MIPMRTGARMKHNPQWFCLTTNPNCQTRAQLGLHAIGYRTFLPKVKRWVSHARVRTVRERPLLGRYVFVEVDIGDDTAQSFGAVKGVNGVESMVSVCGEPCVIPRHFVDGFLRRYLDGEWDFVTQQPVRIVRSDGSIEVRDNEPIPRGARVKIMEGEFADMLATVTNREGRRFTAKLHGTNQHVKVFGANIRPWAGEVRSKDAEEIAA